MKWWGAEKMSPWYQPGNISTASERLTPETILGGAGASAVNLVDNTAMNSSVVDTNNTPKKTLKVTLTSTGTITDYLVKLRALSSQENANFSEIVSEIYEGNGIYHWNLEDYGRYFMVQAQALGTADALNYVTIQVDIEGIS